MQQPKVSIVVPIYKVPEQFLRHSIESCIGQTLKDIEIILVDDGSPDDCGKICDEYVLKDARVKVIHKVNGGLAAARNSGQDAATGETLMFLDGDDWLEPNCCENTYNIINEKQVQLVLFDNYYDFNNSSSVFNTFKDDKGARSFTPAECKQLQKRVLDFNGDIAAAFCKLIKLQFLRDYNIRHIDELRQGAEGFVFNIQLFEHLERAYYIDKPLLHYIYNGQSISHTASVKNNMLIIDCMKWIDEYVKSSRNPEPLHPWVLNRMLYVICTTAITGYFNPSYKASYKDKLYGFKSFLDQPLVRDAIQNAPLFGLDRHRKLILALIRLKQFRLISILGWIRRKQLDAK